MTIIEVAVIAGMKRSSNMTVATIAPTEELEGDVTLLDGFTDTDVTVPITKIRSIYIYTGL